MGRIMVDNNAVEMHIFFWESVASREKVGESYLNEMGALSQMGYFYNESFDSESVRRALSSISNHEPFSGKSKQESRYWNNNMWMLEDKGLMRNMVNAVKTLNVEEISSKLDKAFDEIKVVFVPSHIDEYIINENVLAINFFKIKCDLYEEDKVTIEDKDIKVYIHDKLLELLNK